MQFFTNKKSIPLSTDQPEPESQPYSYPQLQFQPSNPDPNPNSNTNQNQRISSKESYMEERTCSTFELSKHVWTVGIASFGFKGDFVGDLRRIFVEELKSVSQQNFQYILQLCQTLPGPTPTLALLTLSHHSTQTLRSPLIALLCLSAPTAVLTLLVHSLWSSHNLTTSLFSVEFMLLFWFVNYVLDGFGVVTVAVLIRGVVGEWGRMGWSGRGIGVGVGVVAWWGFGRGWEAVVGMYVIGGVFGALVGWIRGTEQQKQNPTYSTLKFTHPALGLKNLLIFLSILFTILFILPPYQKTNGPVFTFSSFFKIGALAFGNENVVLPLMNSYFLGEEYSSQYYGNGGGAGIAGLSGKYSKPLYGNVYVYKEEYTNGFVLFNFLPGPLYNLAGFVGGDICGNFSSYTSGFLASLIAIHLPSILLLLTTLPYHQTLQSPPIASALKALKAVSFGLMLSSTLILYEFQVQEYPEFGTWRLLITVMVGVAFLLLLVPVWRRFLYGVVFVGGAVVYTLFKRGFMA